MERERNSSAIAKLAYGAAAFVIKAFERIRSNVCLHVDRLDAVPPRPPDRLLDRQLPAHVDAYAVDKCHLVTLLPAMASPAAGAD